MALVLTGQRLFTEAPRAKRMKAVVGGAPQPLAGELTLLAEVLGHAERHAEQQHQHYEYLQQQTEHSVMLPKESGRTLSVALLTRKGEGSVNLTIVSL